MRKLYKTITFIERKRGITDYQKGSSRKKTLVEALNDQRGHCYQMKQVLGGLQ